MADFRSLPALPKAALVKPTPVAHPMSPRYKGISLPSSVQFSMLNCRHVRFSGACSGAQRNAVLRWKEGRARQHGDWQTQGAHSAHEWVSLNVYGSKTIL